MYGVVVVPRTFDRTFGRRIGRSEAGVFIVLFSLAKKKKTFIPHLRCLSSPRCNVYLRFMRGTLMSHLGLARSIRWAVRRFIPINVSLNEGFSVLFDCVLCHWSCCIGIVDDCLSGFNRVSLLIYVCLKFALLSL